MTVTAARPRSDSGANGEVSVSAGWSADLDELLRLSTDRSGTGGFTVSGCFPDDRSAHAPQLDQIVDGADQVELALRSDQAAQRKTAEAAPLDLADDRFDRRLPLGVDRAPTFSAQSPPHAVRRAQALGNAPSRRTGRRRPMTIAFDGDVGLDGPPVAVLQRLHVGLGEIATVRD